MTLVFLGAVYKYTYLLTYNAPSWYQARWWQTLRSTWTGSSKLLLLKLLCVRAATHVWSSDDDDNE